MSRIADASIAGRGPEDEREQGALDELVATCLESGDGDVESAIERVCSAHPESADEIRRRVARLRSVGMLGVDPPSSGDAYPEELGEFRLLERLGGGGMGVVFRARQEPLGREVALKLIRPEHLYFPRARERFRRETEAVARLQHPGIVPIYTVGEAAGLPYFAMELVEGATLAELLLELAGREPVELSGEDLARALRTRARAGAAPTAPTGPGSEPAAAFAGGYVESVLRLVLQVAQALEHAHERGVLHRDVKPSNVAVDLAGRARLFDFGLASLGDGAARITQTRTEIGSLPYMAPESLGGRRDESDARSDVYSLGMTLYELLALRLPFETTDEHELRRAILQGDVPSLRARNPAVPRDLAVVCAKALERDPRRRYSGAGVLARDLAAVLAHRPIEARPPSAVALALRAARRHPLAWTLGALAVVVPSALLWRESQHARSLGTALAEAERQRRAVEIESRDARQLNDFLLGLFSSVDPSYAEGREVTARDVLDAAAHRLESELDELPLVRARLCTTIGESYASLGEWERADGMLARGRTLIEAAGAEESRAMAQNLRASAMLDLALGRPGAAALARRAVELERALADGQSFELADALMCAARALENDGSLEDAERTYREALSAAEAIPGDLRTLRAGVLANLANVAIARRDLEGAYELGRQAVELRRSVGLEPHPLIGTALNVMALAATTLGRHDEARALYRELLDEEGRLTGTESQRFATFLVSFSNVELETGRCEHALELLREAERVLARAVPATHDMALRCREGLAAALRRLALWDESLAVGAAALEASEEAFGAANRRTLSNRVFLALSRELAGAPAAAEVELALALERALAAGVAEDDAVEGLAAAQLARLLVRRGELAGAERWLLHARERCGDAGPGTTRGAWLRLASGAFAARAGEIELARVELGALRDLQPVPTQAEWAPVLARAYLAEIE